MSATGTIHPSWSLWQLIFWQLTTLALQFEHLIHFPSILGLSISIRAIPLHRLILYVPQIEKILGIPIPLIEQFLAKWPFQHKNVNLIQNLSIEFFIYFIFKLFILFFRGKFDNFETRKIFQKKYVRYVKNKMMQHHDVMNVGKQKSTRWRRGNNKGWE